MKTSAILLLVLWVMPIPVTAQIFEHTLQYDESVGSPEATLSDISWIEGHWRGEAFGGITEEIWSPPMAGSMMCSFRLIVDGEVEFYEMVTITEENGSLMLRLKHFNTDLTGWEEKEETVDFRLVRVSPDKVYFDGFTFERLSDDEIVIYVVVGNEEGEYEQAFPYRRVINR